MNQVYAIALVFAVLALGFRENSYPRSGLMLLSVVWLVYGILRMG